MRKIRFAYFIGAAILGWTLGTITNLRGADDATWDREKVRSEFLAGFGGDEAALERGLAAASKTLADSPGHAEALVWHGAGTYFRSGQAFLKGDKQRGGTLFQEGLAEMDRAVETAPDNLEVRLTRGTALINSVRQMGDNPIVEGLLRKVVMDYEKARAIAGPQAQGLSPAFQAEIRFGLGEAHEGVGEKDKARVIMQRLSDEMPETEHGKRARNWRSKAATPAGR